jgi:hypothetical protein
MSSEKWDVGTAKKWAIAYLYWRSEGINSLCSVIYNCGGCWAQCGQTTPKEREAIAKAILEDRVIWFDGQLCEVVDDDRRRI